MRNTRVVSLDPDLPVADGHRLCQVEKFVFPGGEPHVRLGASLPAVGEEITIQHRLNSPQAIIELLLANDALRRRYPTTPIHAFIPYIPFARQDRVMVDGEPFSLKVFANLIDSAGFATVQTLDPHSEVSAALLDPLVIRPLTYLRSAANNLSYEENVTNFILVTPDGGALKKMWGYAKSMDYSRPIYTATKHRDTRTGKITGTTIEQGLPGLPCLIIDDICDGGRTFIELAKELRGHGAPKVYLAVTHGIFSKGEAELRSVIDKIYTTTSIRNESTDFIKRYPIS
jgi:ribose-phosphate pyrophosphokinase